MISELNLNLKEIHSSLVILQKSLNNYDEEPTIENIDHCLELIIEKMKKTIDGIL